MTDHPTLMAPTTIEDKFARQSGRTVGESMDDICPHIGEPLDLAALNWLASALYWKIQEVEP